MSLLLALLLLTPVEKVSARAYLNAARMIGQAESVATEPDTLWWLNRAQRGVSEGAFGLLGGLSEREGQPIPRAEQVRVALDHAYWAVRENVPSAIAVAEANHEDETARLLRDEVLPRLARVDQTLTYLDPTPQPLLPGQTVPAVIGPHGDYYRAIRHLFEGPHYGRDMIDEGVLPMYRQTRAPELLQAFRKYVYIADREYQAALRIAGLVPTSDRFCSVLEAARLLSDARDTPNRPDAPEVFQALLQDLAAVTADPAMRRALIRLGDWWAHNDAAMWQTFVFRNQPQLTRCGL